MMSPERVRELFSYDPGTGELVRASGQLAGCVRSDGYRVVTVGQRSYYAHRLIWLMVTGEVPEYIDHIDGDRSNNRLANLRCCTAVENNRNQSMRKDNRSGVTGVHRHGDGNKWAAQIKSAPGKTKHLGLFSTVEEAERAVAAARLKYGYHPNHGRQHDGPTFQDGVA